MSGIDNLTLEGVKKFVVALAVNGDIVRGTADPNSFCYYPPRWYGFEKTGASYSAGIRKTAWSMKEWVRDC